MKKIYVIVTLAVTILIFVCAGIRVGKFITNHNKGKIHYIDDFE